MVKAKSLKVKSLHKDFLTLSFIVIFTVALALVCVCYSVYSTFFTALNANYVHNANYIDDILNDILTETDSYTRFVGTKIAGLQTVSPTTVANILSSKFPMNPEINILYSWTLFDWIEPNNMLVANSAYGVLTKPVNMSMRSHLKFTKKQPWKLIFSDPTIGIPSGKIVIPAAMGIVDKNKKFLGTLVTGINISKLNERLLHILSEKYIEYMIVDSSGQSIATSYAVELSKRKVMEISTIIAGAKAQNGFLDKPLVFDNVTMRYYKKLDHYPFYIILGVNKRIFRENVQAELYPHFFELCFLGAVSILLLFYYKRKVVAPIHSLVEAVNKISKGESVKIPKLEAYEFMILAQQIEVVQNFNNTLLRAVDERTIHLQDALDAKRRIINNVSHELRTPLHAIINLSSALIEQWPALSEQEKQQYCRMLYDSSLRLEELVSNILDLSAAENNQFRLYITKFNIISLVEETINQCQGIAVGLHKKINYSIRTKEHFNPEIRADRRKIKQVLYNLISNAIKYGYEENEIEVFITYTEQDNILTIEIKDCGIGIPNEETEKIFEVFTESSNTRSMSGGKGLGLALCREIVRLHEGKIWASNNEDGVGSTFYFTIPQYDITQPQQDTASEVQSIAEENECKQYSDKIFTKNHPTIMIIDDEEIIMNVVSLMLHELDCNIITMQGGKAALEFFEQNDCHVDLILLDLMMSDLSGLKLLEIIKKDPSLCKIPVIIQSGLHDEMEIKMGMELGAEGFISKPYNKQEMIAAINKALS